MILKKNIRWIMLPQGTVVKWNQYEHESENSRSDSWFWYLVDW